MASVCPRDGTALSAGGGALGEDVCASCHGRQLDTQAVQRLFVDILGVPDHVLRELARDGARKINCPACGSRMTETWARGVQVDLCAGCGGAWLDGGELTRLSRDLDEVRVAPATGALELDLSSRATRAPLQFEVRCVNCERALDLTQTNWLINTRPWCAECARPYTGLLPGLDGGWLTTIAGVLLGGILTAFTRGLWSLRGSAGLGDSGWTKSPDVLKIVPADAERYFGSFFVVKR